MPALDRSPVTLAKLAPWINAGLLIAAVLLACCAASAVRGAQAASPPLPPTAQDAAIEKHALRVAEELRCLVCQNQTLATSDADLAVDLRRQIREQIKAGASDDQIKEFMVHRYGDFVLYRPPVKLSTLMLWFGPLLLLLAGAAMAVRIWRQRRRVAVHDLTDAEKTRAQALLDGVERD